MPGGVGKERDHGQEFGDAFGTKTYENGFKDDESWTYLKKNLNPGL